MTERTAPTLDDVARAAGVSRATASRVINGVFILSAYLLPRNHCAQYVLREHTDRINNVY